jgi:hypothetical protein
MQCQVVDKLLVMWYNVYRERRYTLRKLKKQFAKPPEQDLENTDFRRIPMNIDEMYAHLSGKEEHRFREPKTAQEKKIYDGIWKKRGKGYTKPKTKKADRKKKRVQARNSKKANRK